MSIPVGEDKSGNRLRIMIATDEMTAQDGYAPTVREIAKRVGLSSPDTVMSHLRTLRAEGRVDWMDGLSRTLRVLVPR